jgi:hypothetical protein
VLYSGADVGCCVHGSDPVTKILEAPRVFQVPLPPNSGGIQKSQHAKINRHPSGNSAKLRR